MASAEINAELVCPLGTPSFPPGTHDYDPKRHDLIEGVSKCMISREEAQAKFNEYHEAQGSHDEVYPDGSKMNERVGAAAVINRHFQDGETTCRQLSKRLPDNSTIFAAEATAITLALNYYRHMGPVHHDVVVYFDSMSCLQAIEGEDTENPFICHIMNLLWLLSNKGTHVRFCWIPSQCGIEGNEKVDQLAKKTLDQDIDPLASVHYTDLKPLVNSYIQKLVQTKWDVAVHGRDLYLVKPTLGPPKKVQHLTRAEEVVITRLRIGHTKATKSHILSWGPPTACHHCGQTLTIEHMLLECALLQECRDEYYTVDSLNALFKTIPETCILWHWRKWKSGSTSKRDPRPRSRPTGKCPLYRYETTGQLLHSEVGSNQVRCSCTWQRSLSCETNTGATEEIPAPNQGGRGCNHPTSNWPYQGHQILYLVPRTTNWLSPLWSNTDHWLYAAGVCIVTGMSWWILHNRLVECSLQDNSWDLHSRIPASSIWYDVIY